MVKLPKAPKKTASISTKENYLKRVAEVQKENKKREAINRKSEALDKRIAGIRRK